jgi:hypothetical protein
MKFRHVFTVIRPFSARTVEAAKADFGIYEDEGGEMLYGGSGSNERIDVTLQRFVPYTPDGVGVMK